MSDKKDSNKDSEINFTSSPSFQKSLRKSKWKQIILYTIISCITLAGLIIFIHLGTQHLIDNKIDKLDDKEEQKLTGSGLRQGAGITGSMIRFHYNLFSVTAKETSYKEIGNRRIVWDTLTRKIPAIGSVTVVDRGSGMSETNTVNKEANRVVRYNQLNNERIIDFYYPGLSYDFLPNELDIAIGLDENKLVEVALSFDKPMKLNALGKVLGYKNIDWLWANSTTKKQMKKLEEKWNDDTWKVKRGEDAYGYSVSEDFPYSKNSKENTTINGAVVSGTPKELKRFQDMEIIRASVIGVTIDKY